jgi:hypothetical protein
MPPVSQSQFDADLAAQQQATTDYIAAVDAFIALPPVIDLSTEDASVQTALTNIAAARGRIPGAPPPPPKPAA